MRADRRDPVIAALRKHKPTKFEATLRDGTKKIIPLSTKQNRWELLSDTLEALPWVAIEALDNEGQLLGAIERDGDFDDETDPDIAKGESFARIIAGVVSSTMAECRKMFEGHSRAQAEAIRSLVDSHSVVTENFQLALKIQAAAIGQAQPEETDNVAKMLQMALALKMGGSPAITVAPPAKPTPAKTVNGKAT